MKYCSKNHKNPDDALFCNECGEKLLSIATSNKCSSNPKDAVFCHNCGTSLEKQTNISAIKQKDKPKVDNHTDHTNKYVYHNDGFIKSLIIDFVEEYKKTSDYIGKLAMLAASILAVLSLYRFINCWINDSGWLLLFLSIDISFLGLCYRKKTATIVWLFSTAILNMWNLYTIIEIESIFGLIPNDVTLLEFFWWTDFICSAIAGYNIYKKRYIFNIFDF